MENSSWQDLIASRMTWTGNTLLSCPDSSGSREYMAHFHGFTIHTEVGDFAALHDCDYSVDCKTNLHQEAEELELVGFGA